VAPGKNTDVVTRLFETYLGGRTDEALELLADDAVFFAEPELARAGAASGPRGDRGAVRPVG
jgi:ketosteroid isomerase-like protein